MGTAAMSQLQRLCNRAVRVTCGMRKYDHVSANRLGWLPFDLRIDTALLSFIAFTFLIAYCVRLDPPVHLVPIILMGLGCLHIFVLLLGKKFSDQKP